MINNFKAILIATAALILSVEAEVSPESIANAGWKQVEDVLVPSNAGTITCKTFTGSIAGKPHRLLFIPDQSRVCLFPVGVQSGPLIASKEGIFGIYWTNPFRLMIKGQNASIRSDQELRDFIVKYEENYKKDKRALVSTRLFDGVFGKSNGIKVSFTGILAKVDAPKQGHIRLSFNQGGQEGIAEVVLSSEGWEYVSSTYAGNQVPLGFVKASRLETQSDILRRNIGEEAYQRELQKETNGDGNH